MGEYSSVEEMVKTLSGESFADEFADFDKKTWLSQHLSAIRIASGITEHEIAKRLGCDEKCVVDFEYQETGKIKVSEIALYLNALGFDTRLVFTDKEATHADKIKCLVLETTDLLSDLVKVSEPGEDEKITEEVSKFLIEYFVNVSRLFLEVVSSQFPKPDADAILDTLERLRSLTMKDESDHLGGKIQFSPPLDVSSIRERTTLKAV